LVSRSSLFMPDSMEKSLLHHCQSPAPS
jgi:hypothetical protein